MLTVPFLDLGPAQLEVRAELEEACRRVLASGRYLQGGELAAFEEAFAGQVQARHCVGAGNGLDALELALRAMDVGPGDEVIVPSHTYIATWLAVMHCRARPVPVEPDPRSYTITAAGIADALGPRTRAVIPVHLYGQPADMDPILALARERDLRVLSDAAQAHGARYRGRPVGALGDACAWSFYPGKNLGALGDGGAVTTDDAGLAERVRLLGNYGAPAKHVHLVPGRNSRLDELQAAMLRVKLTHLEAWNRRRAAVAARYLEALAGTGLILPWVAPYAGHAWHLFVVRSRRRDALRKRLAERGVQTQVHYPTPPHRQPACRALGLDPEGYPIAGRLHREVLSLPIGPHLAEAQVDDAIRVLREVVAETGEAADA